MMSHKPIVMALTTQAHFFEQIWVVQAGGLYLCIQARAVGQIIVGAAIGVEGGFALIGAQRITGVIAGGLVSNDTSVAEYVW